MYRSLSGQTLENLILGKAGICPSALFAEQQIISVHCVQDALWPCISQYPVYCLFQEHAWNMPPSSSHTPFLSCSYSLSLNAWLWWGQVASAMGKKQEI